MGAMVNEEREGCPLGILPRNSTTLYFYGFYPESPDVFEKGKLPVLLANDTHHDLDIWLKLLAGRRCRPRVCTSLQLLSAHSRRGQRSSQEAYVFPFPWMLRLTLHRAC